jgi:putative NADH-flavin reductase/mannose-6-phosphate isomerase-like protein (cupin superfamily)
MLVKILS